jgi:hypothetical protein
MVTFVVLCTSNIVTITWVGSHELLMKLITTTKVSYPTCNIQRSKEVVHVTHNTREGWTYFSLVLSTTFENNSFTNYHQEGK